MHSAQCIKLYVNFLTLFLAGIIINLFWAEKHWRQQDATASKTAPSSLLLTFAMAKTNQEIQSTCKETVRTQSQHFFIQIYIRSPKQFLFPWAGGQHSVSITSGCAIPLSLLPHLHRLDFPKIISPAYAPVSGSKQVSADQPDTASNIALYSWYWGITRCTSAKFEARFRTLTQFYNCTFLSSIS